MSELHPTSPLLWALLLALPGLISGKQRGPCAAIFAEPWKPSASLEVSEGGIERGGLGGGLRRDRRRPGAAERPAPEGPGGSAHAALRPGDL